MTLRESAREKELTDLIIRLRGAQGALYENTGVGSKMKRAMRRKYRELKQREAQARIDLAEERASVRTQEDT